MHASAQKGQGVVDKVLSRLKKETARIDGESSEAHKNALKMTATFDENYKGTAVIDGKTGKAIFGPKFLNPSASSEMSVEITKFFNALSTSDKQLFVMRHELGHMSQRNLSLQRDYRFEGRSLPRYRRDFEIDATERTFEFMRGL
ncbi:hypothetical protein [Marinagarivorans algicola]|uniref:hypothetical protein n=1 Tax=Marinagarivorans algicola TaxID=1513270 RepID=UPI0037357BD2